MNDKPVSITSVYHSTHEIRRLKMSPSRSFLSQPESLLSTDQSTYSTGMKAEDAASQFLSKQGLILIDRNFRSRFGEIDLILMHEKPRKTYLVFTEVRYRASAHYGSAAATVTRQKQKRIIQTAKVFIQKKKWQNLYYCRFDVVAMTKNINNTYVIKWLPSAFYAY